MDPTTKQSEFIYLDNNATTLMSKPALDAFIAWSRVSNNASSESALGKQAASALESARTAIAKHLKINTDDYRIIFTGSATESNCMLIRSVVESYNNLSDPNRVKREAKYEREKFVPGLISTPVSTTGSDITTNTGVGRATGAGVASKRAGRTTGASNEKPRPLPHIITSSIEHKSIIDCCERLRRLGQCEVTYIQPNIYGNVKSEEVRKHIRANTCLITIMHANNELGTVNNIHAIADIAAAEDIPFHTDMVQTFARFPQEMRTITAITACFHKFHGPTGLGLLVLHRGFLEGYDINAIISGSQQYSLRGGTEPIPAIVAGMSALEHVMVDRLEKNRRQYELIKVLYKKLTTGIPANMMLVPYLDYLKDVTEHNDSHRIILLGAIGLSLTGNVPENSFITNTVMMAFIPNINTKKRFCNVKLKLGLEKKANIIVSIGSACNTSSSSSSHVIESIKATPAIKSGVIRVSLSDATTRADIETFVETYLELVGSGSCLDGR